MPEVCVRNIIRSVYFLQEEEILDLLEQCEADEIITFDSKNGNRPMSKGPKVYQIFLLILSLSYDTFYDTCNVIFVFLFSCVAIPFKLITCCFALFFSLCHPCQVQNPHKIKQMPLRLPLILQTHQTRCHYGLHLLKRHQPIIASYYPALLRRE